MKKFLAALMCGVMIVGSLAFTACGDKDDGDSGSAHMPTIPSGVNLTAVADADMLDKLDSIFEKVWSLLDTESDNVAVDYYYRTENYNKYAYTDVQAETVKHERIEENLVNIDVLEGVNGTYLDAFMQFGMDVSSSDTGVKQGDENYDRANFTAKQEKATLLQVRDNICTSNIESDKRYEDGKLVGVTSGLTNYTVDDSYIDNPFNAVGSFINLTTTYRYVEDYLRHKNTNGEIFVPSIWDISSGEGYENCKKSDFDYDVEFKANDTKLYIKVKFSFEYERTNNGTTHNVRDNNTIAMYVDTAADHTEDNFDEAKIDTANILYIPVSSTVKTDFQAGHEVKVNSLGGGNKDKFQLSYCGVEYVYNGQFDYVRFDASLLDGKLIIPANTYQTVIDKITLRNDGFDEAKLTELALNYSADYRDYPEEGSGETAFYECSVTVSVVIK